MYYGFNDRGRNGSFDRTFSKDATKTEIESLIRFGFPGEISDSNCNAYFTKSEAETSRNSRIRRQQDPESANTFKNVFQWEWPLKNTRPTAIRMTTIQLGRPSKPVVAPRTAGNEALIVRDPEGPRQTAKSTQTKPVAKAKVASPAPAAPVKKSSPCGGKGQRTCKARPM